MSMRLIPILIALCIFWTPAAVSAAESNAQPPANCERACSQSNAGRCAARDVTANPNGDQQCASSRIGIVSYTKLSSFGNAGSCVDKNDNNQCASGSCTSWKGETTFGVAHRTFPMGTKMEVCNISNGKCAMARVLDRGPASYVTDVTVDARAELALYLGMGCNNKIASTYKVLEVPGVAQTAEPSGPTPVGIEAILAAQRNGAGVGTNMTYQAANTPWGSGYVGTPPPIGSSAYAGMGAPNYAQTNSTVYGQTFASGQGYFDSTGKWVGATSATAGSGTGGKATAGILVQPTSAKRGDVLMVSWTSVNMLKDTCLLTFQNQEFARGIEGFKVFKTVSSDNGVLAFTLKCQDAAGQQYTSSASSTIQ